MTREEALAAVTAERALSDLAGYARRFWHALQLFDTGSHHVREQRLKIGGDDTADRALMDTMWSWTEIAACDCAMTIFHFSKALDALKQLVGKNPVLTAAVDHEAFREARRAFRRDFPNFEHARHAVAHAAEIRNTDKNAARHGINGPMNAPGIVIGAGATQTHVAGLLAGRSFTNTYEGRLVTIEISWETLMKLDGVLAQLHAAFETPKRAPSNPD